MAGDKEWFPMKNSQEAGCMAGDITMPNKGSSRTEPSSLGSRVEHCPRVSSQRLAKMEDTMGWSCWNFSQIQLEVRMNMSS